jgi:hypothetical protein
VKFTDNQPLPGSPGKIDENGFLRLSKVRLGRVGVQQYLGSELPGHLGFEDNEVVNVYRPPEEVFSDDSIATLQGLPTVIKAHEWKSPDNNNASGSVSGVPARDGDDIIGQLLITDGKAIVPIQDRSLSDISLSYQAEVQKESGDYQGEKYQAVQRKIRYNHVAILRPGGGRAGKNIRIEDKKAMDYITFNTPYGDIQVSPESKPALTKLQDACAAGKEGLSKMEDSNEKLVAKVADFDKVKSELEDAKKDNEKMKGELKAKGKQLKDAEDPEELEKKAKELNDAQAVGKAIMGDKVPKGLGASALKLAIATHYAREGGIIGDSDKPTDDYLLGIYGVAAGTVKESAPRTIVPHSNVTFDNNMNGGARQRYHDNLIGKEGK